MVTSQVLEFMRACCEQDELLLLLLLVLRFMRFVADAVAGNEPPVVDRVPDGPAKAAVCNV